MDDFARFKTLQGNTVVMPLYSNSSMITLAVHAFGQFSRNSPSREMKKLLCDAA